MGKELLVCFLVNPPPIAGSVEIVDEDAEPAMLDLALIGAAQKVEHYEIAGHGTARTLAELAGEEDVAAILQQTLDEEGETDELLTSIARELSLSAETADSTTGNDESESKPGPTCFRAVI